MLRILALVFVTLAGNVLFLRGGGWAEQWALSPTASGLMAGLYSLMMLAVVLQLLASLRIGRSVFPDAGRPPTSPELYLSSGVIPPDPSAGAVKLYLDLVRRTVANLIYEDRPAWLVRADRTLAIVDSFDLESRLVGRDQPTQAFSMIGWKRLEQLQQCIEQVLLDGVPGDLIELGVARGGAAVLMRAVLKAHDCRDRRVFACDTYEYISPAQSAANSFWMPTVARILAAIPGARWRRYLTKSIFQKYQRSFPPTENPSEDLVQITLFHLRHPETEMQLRGTGVEHVRSHFARFGLWDDQVVLLKGFFADTIPHAPIEQLAVLRLDGDTFESTRDALNLTYAKLSPGGYCIIDDYWAFTECRRAVEEYRTAHGIQEAIVSIDKDGVYWRKDR